MIVSEIHYFAASHTDWRVSTDQAALVETMESFGYPFELFRVPCDIETAYEIREFRPTVPGTEHVASYRPGQWGEGTT